MSEAINIQFNSQWTGYKNFRDPTNMSITDMTAGSQNVFATDGEKLEVRAGMDYLGDEGTVGVVADQAWVPPHRIHSKYDEFINVQGVRVPIRVFYSGTAAQGDVIEAWLPIDGDPETTDKEWKQVTADAPATPLESMHRYYFDQWWDGDVFQSRMVFTTGTDSIKTWTGGFAPITSLTATTLTTDGIWQAKGFIDSTQSGTDTIVVNGNEYTVTSGFGTDTVTVASTAGIAPGDIAFHGVDQFDTLGGNTIYDVCSTINNQVYYIDWDQRNVYVSWNRNQDGQLGVTTFSGSGINDALFTGTYTDTANATFKAVVTRSVPLDQNDNTVKGRTTFFGSGPNTVTFDGTGYTGPTNRKYKLIITWGLVPAGASQLVYLWYEDGTIVSSGNLQDPATGLSLGNGPFPLSDGITFTLSSTVVGASFPAGAPPYTTYGGTINPGDTWEYTIGDTDLVSVYKNDVLVSADVAIPSGGGSIPIADGISIDFNSDIGHDLGDTFFVNAYREVDHGWAVFTYTTPGRLPGEGFTLLLDSNGWTMKPQEDVMYITSQAGHFYTAKLSLSADLLTENLRIERLKSEPMNKPLYPYLIGYIKNQLAAITDDLTYDSIGRQELLQLPQTVSISDEIRVDFETTDWEDGHFIYNRRKIYFLAPREGKMFVYDLYKKYWHSPMVFGRRGSLLSVIDNKLCMHSYERNETYELFVGTNDLDEYGIDTKIVLPYDNFNERIRNKQARAIGFEGYIAGAPEITYKVNFGIAACKGQWEGQIKPFSCQPKDRASLGKSNLGFHGLGNDPVELPPHFYYIETHGKQEFRMRNIEIECSSRDQRWAIVAMGTDAILSLPNNADITKLKTIT